uniref:DAZ-associated protein 2 n=1 Tax=Sus scrofa TaxID=9823 RepID=A0A8D0WU62_PIG
RDLPAQLKSSISVIRVQRVFIFLVPGIRPSRTVFLQTSCWLSEVSYPVCSAPFWLLCVVGNILFFVFCFFSCLPGQYPTQPTYPVQPPGNPVYPQTLHLPQAPPYTDAPPAYSELYRPSFVHPGAATVPTMSAAFPGASLYLPMAQSVAVGPLGSTIPMAYYPVGPIYPPGSTVLVEGGYDTGARFGAGATAGNIPPPPPGCPPNAAQLAVMQGANVLVTQRKGNFFMGGSDGGYTIW